MSSQEGTLKYSDLINRLILDLRTAEELGRVDDLWTAPEEQKVVGIVYKSGFLSGQRKSLPLGQLQSIGPDAIMVSVEGETSEEAKPGESSLVGHEVWTDGGSHIGKISDFLFDAQSGIISHYLFVAAGWSGITDGTYLLETSAITTSGKRRVIVPEATAKSSTLYSEGIRQRLGSALDQAKERGQNLSEQIKERTAALSEQARGLVDQAKERSQSLGDQHKERTAALGEQAKGLVDQAKERGQTFVESAQERLNPPHPSEEATVPPSEAIVPEQQALPAPGETRVAPAPPHEPQPPL